MTYAELATATNFSFLTGASQPADMVEAALALGHNGLGIADQNSVAGVVRVRRFALQGEEPAWLKHATLQIGDAGKSLPVGDGRQFRYCQQLLRHVPGKEFSILNQRRRFAFHPLIESLVSEQEPDNHVVGDQQRKCANEPAEQGIVIADDRVLNGVRK